MNVLPSLLLLTAATATAQNVGTNYAYIIKPLAGTSSVGNGLPATQALFKQPIAVVAEASGSYAILDSGNHQIRRVASDGTVTLVATLDFEGVDMKAGRDGSFYVTATAQVFKVSATGEVTVIAGNGIPGSSRDGGLATAAQLDASTTGVAVDQAGNVYFVDGARIRKVNAAGIISTVAGLTQPGYSGDNGPATAAQLNYPKGLAVDLNGNIYIPDLLNYRVRKVTVINGTITTIAGNGSYGFPVDGPAAASPLQFPYNITVDGFGSVYFTDIGSNTVIKLDSAGTLTKLAGGGAFSYADTTAANVYLDSPAGVAVEAGGNVLFTEIASHRVRRISAGNVRTVAGRIRTGGDGGPAIAAALNSPLDIAFDGLGNLFIADGLSYRARKVTADGFISTLAGIGTPGSPMPGASANVTPIPNHYAVAADTKGNVYLAAQTQIFRITANGVIDVFAGATSTGNSGDGGPASRATFTFISGLAVDPAGNLYIGDHASNRVRKVSATDGIITAFAGTGVAGFAGDNGPAASAQLRPNYSLSLAADSGGNIYISDSANYRIRMVSTSGIITTVAGNGQQGEPQDGAQARGAPLNITTGVAVDSAGVVYLSTTVALYFGNHSIYRVEGGVIRAISGRGVAPPVDNIDASTIRGFDGHGMRTDSNGDLIVADYNGSVVRKLMRNSPRELVALDGNNQWALAGAALPKPLKVQANGRAGLTVPAEPVTFKVTSGDATLSAATVPTDDVGSASTTVTLGSAPGPVTITATAAGLPSVTFTATSQTPLTFSYTIGSDAPGVQLIAITGSATAAVDGDIAWLVAESVDSGVKVSLANLDQLVAGAYNGTVTISAGGMDPLVVPVTLTVQ